MKNFKKILKIKCFFYILFIDLFVLKAEDSQNKIKETIDNGSINTKVLEFESKVLVDKYKHQDSEHQKKFSDWVESYINNGDIIKLEHLISFSKINDVDFKKYLILSKDNILKKRENLNKKLTYIEMGQGITAALSFLLASIGLSSFCWVSWGYFVEEDNNYYTKESIMVAKSAIYGLPPAVIMLSLFGYRLLTKVILKKNREEQYNNALGIDYILNKKFNNKNKLT